MRKFPTILLNRIEQENSCNFFRARIMWARPYKTPLDCCYEAQQVKALFPDELATIWLMTKMSDFYRKPQLYLALHIETEYRFFFSKKKQHTHIHILKKHVLLFWKIWPSLVFCPFFFRVWLFLRFFLFFVFALKKKRYSSPKNYASFVNSSNTGRSLISVRWCYTLMMNVDV